MRQLVIITPARVANRSMPHAQGVYGPLWKDLYRFLAVKYRINDQSMRLICEDVFRYIDAEVMRNGEYFSVPGFGTFRRMQEPSATSHDGSPAEWMKLDRRFRKYNRALFTDQEDDEDAGPRED